MLQTAARLTAACRRLTAERGLAGFTIEEVCEEADVSRRTFFNYFPSKEDAVIGSSSDDDLQQFTREFLALGSRGWVAAVDDLVDMATSHFAVDEADIADHTLFMACLEREPRLLARFVGVSRERERGLAALIAEREGVEADDPRATAVVSVMTTLIQSASERFIAPANTLDFSTILTTSLAAFRTVLAHPHLERHSE
jgi:AcrR family transcriptional regulator